MSTANNTETAATNCNNNCNSNVCTGKSNSQSHFYPITKSVSVPDIHQNPEDTIRPIPNQNKCLRPAEHNNLLVTNSGSIESAIADSPAGSINEQFEANVNTPLSTDDAVDSITDTLRYLHFYVCFSFFLFKTSHSKILVYSSKKILFALFNYLFSYFSVFMFTLYFYLKIFFLIKRITD